MSQWPVTPEQWQGCVDESPGSAAPYDGALDDIDARIVVSLGRAPFPGMASHATIASIPQAGPGNEPVDTFDSMKTVVRTVPTEPEPEATLEVALQSSDSGLDVSLQGPDIADSERPTLVDTGGPAVATDDGEPDALFIPTLTRPAAVVVPQAAPPAERERASASASASASGSRSSGTIRDEDEAAATMTRGEIVRDPDADPDPAVARGKVVVDPAASGVLPALERDEAEELDAEELDAEEIEQLDDTPPPAPNVLAEPSPSPTPRRDGPPPAPVEPAASTPPPAPDPGPPDAPAVVGSSPTPPPPEPVGATAAGGTMPPTERSWVDDVFGEHYVALLPTNYAQLAAQHVGFFLQCTQLPAGARVLDVACGGGAHAISLAGLGYAVTGFDASSAQIARAQASAEAAGVRVGFVLGDMRSPPVDGPFDAALCLGGSFGVFDDDQDEKCLQRIAERLAPGGTLMLHVFNRDHMVGRLPTRSWWQGQGCLVLDEAALDSPTSRVKIHRTVVFEDGRQFDHRYDLRAYGLYELTRACRRAGLAPVEYAGSSHTRGRFFGASSADIWLLVRRD